MRLHIITILLVGILLVAGCGQYGAQTQQTGNAPNAEQAQGSNNDAKEFTVEGSEFKFNPASITVGKGENVRITFKNAGTTGHSFVIGDLGVSTKVIPAGSAESVEFIADKSGTFSFYCSVPGHKDMGMKGEIIVS